MAKKKNNPNDLMSFDFLPNMNQNVGGGLNTQLARLGQAQRMRPLVGMAQAQAFIMPITKMMQDAKANITAGMIEYNDANPDLDDSLLFDGTENILNTQLQENSVKFKELNRKLGFMSPTSKNYAETVKEINKINKSNLNLRDQNTKLLDLRNIIKTKDLQKMSDGMPAHYLKMYTDIQQGKSENFSKDSEGNLVWNNPDKTSKYTSVAVNSIPAEGPEFAQGAANDEAYNTFRDLRQIPKDQLQPEDAFNAVNVMARKIGDPGLKSLVFDNMNNANSPVGDTNEWWKTYAARVGVEPESEAGAKLLEEIRNNGMLHSVGGVRVKDHFVDWLKTQSMNAKKFGSGLPPKPNKEETTTTETGKYGGFLYGRNETSGDPNHPDANKRAGYQNIGYLKQMQNRNTLLNFDPENPQTIRGLHYDYNYDKDEGWQAFNNGDFVKNVKGSQIADIEGLLSANDIKAGEGTSMFNVSNVLKDQKTKAEEERVAPSVPGTVGLRDIEVKGKTARAQHQEVRDNLFNIFNDQFKEEFDILPITTTTGFGGGMFGTGSTTSVVRDKIRIRSKDGSFEKVYDIGLNATRNIADQITQDFNAYIVPIDPDLIIK